MIPWKNSHFGTSKTRTEITQRKVYSCGMYLHWNLKVGFEIYNMTLRHILKKQPFAPYVFSKRGGIKQILKSLERIELMTSKNKSCIKGTLNSLWNLSKIQIFYSSVLYTPVVQTNDSCPHSCAPLWEASLLYVFSISMLHSLRGAQTGEKSPCSDELNTMRQ